MTDAGREPGEAKKDTSKTKDSGSTPRGEQNQFTHFSKEPINVQDNRHSESERWKNETPPRQLIPYRKCWRSGIGPTLKASQDMVTGTLSLFSDHYSGWIQGYRTKTDEEAETVVSKDPCHRFRDLGYG